MFRGKNYLTKNPETKRVEVDCDLYLETLEKLEYKDEDDLLKNGFRFIDNDNTYNYEDYTEKTRELSYTMLWNLYGRKNPRGRGFQYVVEIRKLKENWFYETVWYYKTNENCHSYMLWLLDSFKDCEYCQRLYLNECLDHHRREINWFKDEA